MSLRPAAFDTVADVLLLLDYLGSRLDIDQRRLFLVGSSLGAVAATVAGGIDPRPAAVIVLYGGGRLGSLIVHTLEHPAQDQLPSPHWRAIIIGHALRRLLLPLAPERYVAKIAPRPFVMINGAEDSLVPRPNVLALYEAAPPTKELIWVSGEHVQPSETQLIRTLSGIVACWLAEHGVPSLLDHSCPARSEASPGCRVCD